MAKKEKPTTKTCKHCGTEIPYAAKVCPNCRKKQGMGFFTKIIIVIVVLAVLGSMGGKGKSDTKATSETGRTLEAKETAKETEAPVQVEYTKCDIKTMQDDLKSNALKAKDTYEGKYIEITGVLSNIDASGDYISINDGDPYSISNIMCYIKDDKQMSQVLNMTNGCEVTLRGRCKSVGEVLGYSIDIDSIDGYEASENGGTEHETNADGYVSVSAKELVNALETNALAASNTYTGKKLEVSGRLGTIDSDGKYIAVKSDDPYSFTSILCYIKTDEQKKTIINMSTDQSIVVKGKCTAVGEVMGYSIDIESIE